MLQALFLFVLLAMLAWRAGQGQTFGAEAKQGSLPS